MACRLLSIWLLVFSGTLAADGWSLSLGVGINTNVTGQSIEWDDGGGVGAYFQFEYAQRLSNSLSLQYHWIHLSQWDVGPPFNDEDESSVDHFGVALKWEFLK